MVELSWRGERTGPTLRWGARYCDLISCLRYAVRPARSLTRWSTRAALEAFLRGIRTGEFIGPGLDDAIRVAKLLAAAEKSLITGRTINLLSFELTDRRRLSAISASQKGRREPSRAEQSLKDQ